MNQPTKRIWELDALRGIMILGVVFIHLCFDLDYFLGIDVVKNPVIQFMMDHCGVSFVILSGLCATIGKRSFRRGLQVFGCGMLSSSSSSIKCLLYARLCSKQLTFINSLNPHNHLLRWRHIYR